MKLSFCLFLLLTGSLLAYRCPAQSPSPKALATHVILIMTCGARLSRVLGTTFGSPGEKNDEGDFARRSAY